MAEYTLALSEDEIGRYRFMAEIAARTEAVRWTAAGIVPGAVVADVGCGPAAMSVTLAGVVGAQGLVIGVERDEVALRHAEQVVASAGVPNVELRQGDATDTGIEPGTVDVAMLRHVLAHNGGSEQRIVDHLTTLVRPGGTVYLVDVELTLFRIHPMPEGLDDLTTTYADFHARRGNDPQIGLRLDRLLRDAGLGDVSLTGEFNVMPRPVGLRPPAWAARDAMVADGVIDEATIARWDRAFERLDREQAQPTMFIPTFIATGRVPG